MPRRQRHLGYRLAAVSLVLIALLTLLPDPSGVERASSTPLECLICGDLGGVDLLLNVLLFVPLGFGLALAGFSWRRAAVLAALVSFGIEALQMKVIAGRDASLGDLFTNTLGGGLGALLGISWRRLALPGSIEARRLALAWALGLIWIWAGTAWALGPTWPVGSPWYGQWAADLRSLEPFLGTPLSITAGGEPLLPGLAINQARFEDAVAARPSMTLEAILGPAPVALAPIGSIYDERRHEVMLIGQDRHDLSFRIRMRATILRLRNPTVSLPGGMAGNQGDTVVASAALQNGAFELRSEIGDRTASRSLPLSASWGWSLVLPFHYALGLEAHLLTALWIGGLLAILAYWSRLAGGAAPAIVPLTATALLGLIPYAAGFPPAHWSEWAAAVLGVLSGIGLAGRAQLAQGRAEAAARAALESSPT